jgi:DMSO/TMAO reductase YedYZ molybdopterin-dependent catalytic subunit
MSSKDRGRNRADLPPGQRPTDRLLRWGTDHPGITSSIPKIDPEKWTLVIGGEVENPLKLSWRELLQLPRVESVSDFHCVEGWSVLGCRWEGVGFKYIVKLVKPGEDAKFIFFRCMDGYTTSLSLEDLMGDDVLLAYKLDGGYLEEGIGAPLRLVIPEKYAYKAAMWITEITFSSRKELGYWERRGYSDTADVWKNDRFSRPRGK